jgi:hypothetical protein
MLNPSTDPDFTGKVIAPDASYPFGKARDAAIENDPSATPLLAKKFNDDWGFDAALMAAAGLAPSGTSDTATASQRMEALTLLFGYTPYSTLIANANGAINAVGQKVRSGITAWLVVGAITTSAVAVANTAPQLYVTPLNGVWVADLGVVPDDATDNFAALQYVSTQCKSGWALNFSGGVTRIAYTGAYDPGKIHGQVACPLQSLKNIKINGNGSTIKIQNHDITASNGLMVFTHDAVQGLEVSGFTFDLSYTGRNNSATYYPYNGAILGSDTLGTPGSRTPDQLSSNTDVHHNTFKIYHPQGCYGKAANSFPGDPNNGFKNYAYTALGDDLATAATFQNGDVGFHHNTFPKGHNAYGVWVWAYGNFTADNNTAEAWIAGVTDSAGTWQGFSSIPMIRYIKWYTNGATIGGGNRMISLPTAERVGAFQGAAIYCHATDNMTVAVDVGGMTKVSGVCKLGTGDVGALVGVYGTAHVTDMLFSAHSINDRPTATIDVQTLSGGVARYSIQGCEQDATVSGPLVRIDNGASSAALRRLKSLTIRGCKANNCLDSAVAMVNNRGSAFNGVESLNIEGCLLDGRQSQFSPINSNKIAVSLLVSDVATDKYLVRNSEVHGFFYLERNGAAQCKVAGVVGTDITTSDNYNYFEEFSRVPATEIVVTGVIPRVGGAGGSNVNWYSFNAFREDTASGVVLQATSGEAAGGTSLAGATPAGQQWVLNYTLIGSKALAP